MPLCLNFCGGVQDGLSQGGVLKQLTGGSRLSRDTCPKAPYVGNLAIVFYQLQNTVHPYCTLRHVGISPVTSYSGVKGSR